jgi:hypothetical protein
MTNVLGFILLQKGAQKALSKEDKAYTARSLGRDVLISLLYTLLIVLLVRLGWIKPVTDYFKDR